MIVGLKLMIIGLSLMAIGSEAKRRKTNPKTIPTTPSTTATTSTTAKPRITRAPSKADPSSGDAVKKLPPQPSTQEISKPTPEPSGRPLPIVYLEVLDARIATDYDWLSTTDCYVTIEVTNPGSYYPIQAGKTRVAVDMHNPEFYQVFKLEMLRTDSVVTFGLYDNDYLIDQTIGKVSIEVEKVLKTDQNYKEIKLTFNDNHDYIAIRFMMIATVIDYSEDRKRNEIAKDSLLITCCKWTDFKVYVQNMHTATKDAIQTKKDFEYILEFSSFFQDVLMRKICTEKYFHVSFCSKLNSTDTVPINDQMLSTLLFNL